MESMDMQGKICLIPGSDNCIGKHTALGLAKRRAKVILTCPSPAEAKSVKAEIIERSWNKDVHAVACDLGKQKDLWELATSLDAQLPRLDVLVNAGAIFQINPALTLEGQEKNWAMSVFAPFLLTHLCYPLLKHSSEPRVINLLPRCQNSLFGGRRMMGVDKGSRGRFMDLEKLKQQLQWLTSEQARRYREQKLRVNLLFPGSIRSELFKLIPSLPAHLKAAFWLKQPFMLSDKEGAQDTLFLACSPRVKHISGNLFSRKYTLSHEVIQVDRNQSEEFWEKCNQLAGNVNVQA